MMLMVVPQDNAGAAPGVDAAQPAARLDPRAVPTAGGAYALLLRLARPVTVRTRWTAATLLPGPYAYVGSAYGPGGLRARVARHVRGDGRPHWHVDRLRAAAAVTGLALWPGGNECDWRAAIVAAGWATAPVRGLGSSDCRRCPAHLLALGAPATDAAAVAALARAAAGPISSSPITDIAFTPSRGT
jgi:Uri superfamily endonuclease